MDECTASDCTRAVYSKAMCRTHYSRLWRTGSMDPVRRPSVEDRFWAKVDKGDGPNACWLWLAAIDTPGYGVLKVNGVLKGAHRIAYELLIGPIPDGLVIDHLCRVTRCVNPDHLEPVTNWENVRRGVAPSAINARKSLCIRGHQFVDSPSGVRYCPTCPAVRRATTRSSLRSV